MVSATESSFGRRLRDARVAAGLSQAGLETRSGIPKARLSRYENGHVLPSIATLGRLAMALDVSEASLLGDQRDLAEELASTLLARGVVLQSVEQARKLGNAVADIYEAMGLPGLALSETDAPAVAVATMSDVVDSAPPV